MLVVIPAAFLCPAPPKILATSFTSMLLLLSDILTLSLNILANIDTSTVSIYIGIFTSIPQSFWVTFVFSISSSVI